jgi:hypothetical protein
LATTIVRQILIDKLKTVLQTILKTGGYYTNLGQKVEDGRTKSYFKGTAAAINIRDTGDDSSLDAEDESLEAHQLAIELKLLFKAALSAEEARKGISDVKKAVAMLESDADWNALVDRIRPAGDQMDLNEDEDKIAGVTVNLVIEYTTLALQEA